MYRVFLSRLFPHETRQSIFSRLKFFSEDETVYYFSSQICSKRESLLFLVSNLHETRESIISRHVLTYLLWLYQKTVYRFQGQCTDQFQEYSRAIQGVYKVFSRPSFELLKNVKTQ